MTSSTPLGLLLTCLLLSSARAVYFLRADFHTYNNALHAYWSPESDSGVCCDGNTFPTNCSTSCNTLLRYCFKIYGTYNDISNDDNIINDCLGNLQFSGDLSATDYINYTMPPSTIFGLSTRTSISLRGASWPGKIQFFVRTAVGSNVIDYLVFDFALVPGKALNCQSETINGMFFGSNVTFTVSFDMACVHDSYGSHCIYCLAADSDDSGHYTCFSDGSKQCLPGYVNASTNCTMCEPPAGCENGYCNVPGECICLAGYDGDLCEQGEHPQTPSSPPQYASSSITVVVIVTVTVLTAAVVAVIVISVCVCLLWKRKNKHVNTTDNVAYHSSSGPDMKINEVYAEINDPSISTSTNDAYGITHRANDVTTSQNEAYGVITHPSSGSGFRMNLNEAYSLVNVPSQTGIKTSVNDAYIAVYDHELQLNEK